ncbi:elongator complex protein 6 isoform X1 [Cucurbita maxima]|uniref:Elongator complex protein 6 isoform X1 n=1 Tax=Cucurbita maxima TaxID=3661 RepID=A0A6J1JK13_CUCMA|nr:elongator complex protein 6 isoform X1 [Cucurbita maxima]
MSRMTSNLLDEAIGLDDSTSLSPLVGRLLLVEDCVETSGAFVLHHLLKRAFSSPHSSNAVIFIAFSQSFVHYERVLRKLGCNLAAQRDSHRFFFLDMLTVGCSDRSGKETGEGVLVGLYCKIQRAVSALIQENKRHVTIVIDDIPLLEVAANGSSNHVLDFLHYCHTLTSEIGGSIIALSHEDVYLDIERPLILQMEYLADVLIKVGPLATGIAKDVHGQLTVLNKPVGGLEENLRNRVHNFQFYIKENVPFWLLTRRSCPTSSIY